MSSPNPTKELALSVVHRFGIDVNKIKGVTNPRFRLGSLLNRHAIDVVLDVGANTGQYGDSLREFGYAGRIVSFEPMQREYAQLATHTEADDKWSTHRLALGDEPGTTTINVAGNSISSSMLPMLDTHAEAAPRSTFVSEEQIQVERLDDVFDEFVASDERVFMKLDTQGFERQVLAGATGVMPRVDGMQVEMSLVPLYEHQMLITETLQLVTGYGMELWETERTFTRPTDGRLLQLDGIFFRAA